MTAPTVTAIAPNAGPTSGGTAVTVTGTNFNNPNVSSITIGGAAADNLNIVSATSITCTTTAHAAGAADVVATNTSGSGTLTAGFTYGAPHITGISPVEGSIAGGTAVTITGTGFTGATSVTIGSAAATSIVVVNDTTITCVTPGSTVPGPVNVAVVTPEGVATAYGIFTYGAKITSIAPHTGPAAGGTAVTITGVGFTNATSVHFGLVAATSFVVVNDTSITCVTPPNPTITVDVTVIGPQGSGTAAAAFTYAAVPGNAATFPAFTPVLPPPVIGTGGTVPPVIAYNGGPIYPYSRDGGAGPIIWPGFSTSWPHPPVQTTTTQPPPSLPTTPPIAYGGLVITAPRAIDKADAALPMAHNPEQLPQAKNHRRRNARQLHQ